MRHLRKMLVRAAAAVGVASPVHASIITTPTSLNPGDQYRLAFVTSIDFGAPISPDINVYNVFVDGLGDTALASDWTAIVSTPTVSARNNTSTVPSSVSGGDLGVPIYLFDDRKLADSNDDLWDGTIDVPLQIAEEGTQRGSTVWTGSTANGTIVTGSALGDSIITIGHTVFTDLHWTTWAVLDVHSIPRPIYGISSILTVPTSVFPLPAALPLFGTGLGILGFMGWRRRRKAV